MPPRLAIGYSCPESGPSSFMTQSPRSPHQRVPRPPHPRRRKEPLPEQSPKPAHEDPQAPARLAAIMRSPSYRLAEQDADFLARDDMRGPRLQIEYLKA